MPNLHAQPKHCACRSIYVVYKLQPDELAMKRLAMFGCSALMLAHSAQSPPRGNSCAGLHLLFGTLQTHQQTVCIFTGLMRPLCTHVFCRQVTPTTTNCTNMLSAVQLQELCSRVGCPSLSSLQRSLLQGCWWQLLFFGAGQHRHTFYVFCTAILSLAVTLSVPRCS